MRHALRRKLALAAAALLALPLGQACDYFGERVVPAVDTNKPALWASVTTVESYPEPELIDGSPANPYHYSSFTFELDPGEQVFVALAAVDTGGARRVWVRPHVYWECGSYGEPSYSFRYGQLSALYKNQAGQVGDTVSSGVWTGLFVSRAYLLERIAGCDAGLEVGAIEVRFEVVGWDFHGNWERYTDLISVRSY